MVCSIFCSLASNLLEIASDYLSFQDSFLDLQIVHTQKVSQICPILGNSVATTRRFSLYKVKSGFLYKHQPKYLLILCLMFTTTAWTVKFVHKERPQRNGPGAVPSTTGAVPSTLLQYCYTTAFLASCGLQQWAPGPFLLLYYYTGPRAVPPTQWGRSSSLLYYCISCLIYWAPGPFLH